MLRIEKLFIQGFKSFCDPTELLFDEEGITAVVGPNGCGKSNVADALSWVIGEQRAKALRGGKMEDVIFQGSKNRQPSGMAEVMLTMVVRESFEIRGDAPITDPSLAESAKAENPPTTVAPATAEDSAPESTESGVADGVSVQPEEPGSENSPLQPTESNGAAQPESKKKKKTTPNSLPRVFTEGERVTVGRRLYRSGESEYEMNGRQCRLRDIQDLFAGTGLGGAHYAIIEQGRIGQVLSAKPLDRRALIEEAAGVSKFKMRQHAAEMKLDASKQNLSRINDILIEIERQQNSLRRQAGKARRFRKLQQEMRDLMRAIFVVDYRGTKLAITEREDRLTEIAGQEEAANLERMRLEEEQITVAQLSRTAETLLNETRQVASGIDVEAERLRQQLTFLQEQIQTFTARRAQTDQEQNSINERHSFLEQEIGRLRVELQAVEEEINRESRTLSEAEEEHRALSQNDQAAEARLEERRKLAYESVTQLERWRQLHRQFTESVDRSQARLRGLTVEKERAHEQSRQAVEKHETLTLQVAEYELRHDETGRRLEETVATLAVQRQTREQLQSQLNTSQRDLTATEHRLRSLNELDQRRAYFSESVQAIVKEGQSGQPFRVLGTLADFVNVSPEDELLIESALRDELQYVVVPTVADAQKAIEFLNREGAGRATFLIVGAEPGGGTAELNYRSLESLIGLQPEISAAFRLALPGLAAARIVDSFPAGDQEPLTGTLLTGTGEKIVAGRLVTGGSRAEKAAGVLALKREIEELTRRLATLEENVAATEMRLTQVRQEVESGEEERQRLDGELRQTDKQLAVLREQLQQCNRERERTETHIRVVEQETAQAFSEMQDFDARLAHAATEMGKAESARAEAEQISAAAQEELADFRRQSEERSQQLSRRRAEFAARSERRRGYLNDLRRLESETQELRSRLGRLEFESVEINETITQARQNFEIAKEEQTSLTTRQQQISIEFEERSLQLTNAREQYETIEQSLRLVRDSSSAIREQRAQLEIDLARLTTNLDYLIQTCHSELGENLVEICQRLDQITPSELDPPASSLLAGREADRGESDEDTYDQAEPSNDIQFWYVPDNFDLEFAKARLAEVNSRIDALGPINMMALEELTEIEERFNFLTIQKADLEKAIADTLAAIHEIRRRSKEQFAEAFERINENFKLMFQELFGGGTGEMRLIDQTDILESGIEIIAQPPGKRLQNVLLLSGGEKAMAALSLIMAIFKFRPSPFCLLDEVDAPLDEMNIGRFSDKVLQMSNQTQFLIITHSKRTMEAARTLYGVTMEDPGVSKLISVKLT
ncbi:MAG: chromosome segregation protein SMC [Acidobacteriota bacterium]